ncbi:MAG: 50S ribosomal protein L23 [Chthoniobacteraceae bacterium]
MSDPQDLIKTIAFTEKATILSEKHGKYVFRVAPSANKLQIKAAVESLFGKKVADVNTANFAGKKRRERRADAGRTAHWKKAIVTLKAGEKIELA